MSKINLVFLRKFEQNLIAMFPTAIASGVISRKQLNQVKAKMKTDKAVRYLQQNRIGCGLYSIGYGLYSTPL